MHSTYIVLTMILTPPLGSRIELWNEAVALLRYPTQCLTHKCPGHPH